MKRGERTLPVPTIDHDADTHFARIDHADVDVALGQRAEHLAGDAGVRPHADAPDEQHADVALGRDSRRRIDCRGRGLSQAGRAIEIPFIHVWTVRDGRAVHFLEMFDSYGCARALGVIDWPIEP